MGGAWFWVRMLYHAGSYPLIDLCNALAEVALAYPRFIAVLVFLQNGAAQPVPLPSFMHVCTACTAAGRACPSSTRFSASGTSLSKMMRWGRLCSGCTQRSRTQDSAVRQEIPVTHRIAVQWLILISAVRKDPGHKIILLPRFVAVAVCYIPDTR